MCVCVCIYSDIFARGTYVCVYLNIDSGIFYIDTDISAGDTYVCVYI